MRVDAFQDNPSYEVKGLHEAIVPESLYDSAQAVLGKRKKRGRGLNRSEKSLNLYLRGILLCPQCGRNLTGSYSKGNGGAYAYYHCQQQFGCNARFPASQLHGQIEALLRTIVIDRRAIRLYDHLLTKKLSEKARVEDQKRRTLAIQKEKAAALLDKVEEMWIRDQIARDTYDRQSRKLKDEIVSIESMLQAEGARANVSQYTDPARNMLSHLHEYFAAGNSHIKKRILGSIFPQKLTFDGQNYRTKSVSRALTLISSNINELVGVEPDGNENVLNLSHLVARTGIEPVSRP
ncbi:MAG: zinc ribbon domain-containing protein [Bacteroidetes bacterium]|nr:zinc ribbon domain-containing protein [Bacteroidota bacterium]